MSCRRARRAAWALNRLSAPIDAKMQLRMELGGRAWRGYFPVGGELTSGRPDLKEGIYFGTELPRTATSQRDDVRKLLSENVWRRISLGETF